MCAGDGRKVKLEFAHSHNSFFAKTQTASASE